MLCIPAPWRLLQAGQLCWLEARAVVGVHRAQGCTACSAAQRSSSRRVAAAARRAALSLLRHDCLLCASRLSRRVYWSHRRTDDLEGGPEGTSEHVAFQRMAHFAGLAYLDEVRVPAGLQAPALGAKEGAREWG